MEHKKLWIRLRRIKSLTGTHSGRRTWHEKANRRPAGSVLAGIDSRLAYSAACVDELMQI
jgi:hypothetical protein